MLLSTILLSFALVSQEPAPPGGFGEDEQELVETPPPAPPSGQPVEGQPATPYREIALQILAGTFAGAAAGIVFPLLLFAAVLTPFLVLGWQTYQIGEAFSDIAAVLTVLIGALLATACSLLMVPVWEAFGYTVVAGTFRSVSFTRAWGFDIIRWSGGYILPAALSLPVAGLAVFLLCMSAALIPVMFFLTNSVGIARLGEYFPLMIIGLGSGAALLTLVFYIAGALTVRPLLHAYLASGVQYLD